MKDKLARQTSQILLLKKFSQNAGLVRTYSSPASFHSKKANR